MTFPNQVNLKKLTYQFHEVQSPFLKKKRRNVNDIPKSSKSKKINSPISWSPKLPIPKRDQSPGQSPKPPVLKRDQSPG